MEFQLYIVRITGWFLFLFFGGCAIYAAWTSQYGLIPFLVPFSALGLFHLICWGRIRIDNQGITHSTWLGRYFIAWHEMTHVEMDTTGATFGILIFCGQNDKRLVILGPNYWSKSFGEKALDLIISNMETHKIGIAHKRRLFPLAANTKISF